MSDTMRRWSNLILPPMMWVLSTIGEFLPGARTARDFSDLSDNWLVPLGPAFAIWFPIFIGCIAYGILQFRRENIDNPALKAAGPWTTLGFALICGWALITAFASVAYVQWGTALIFIPAMLALVKGMIELTRRKDALTGALRWFGWGSISLIAGWCSIAVFLNWTPIAFDLFAGGQANLISSLLMLAMALGWVVLAARKAGGNKVYLFPVIWGLAFLAIRHLAGTPEVPAIGWAAMIGIGLLLITAFVPNRAA